MMKNKLWIVALLAALTMAFFGCTDAGEYTPPDPEEKGEWEFVELGPVGFKGGEPGSQQGWYSIGYKDTDLLGTPVATLEQFTSASYLVVKLIDNVPTSISGETAAVQVIWGGDGNGWNSSSNVTVSTAPGSPIRYDADEKELWVELSGKTMSMIDSYRTLKEGARIVLQCWNYSDAYESAKLAIASDGSPPVEPPPEELDLTKYIVPKAGGTFFYLDLNDYKTEGALNSHVPEGFATPTQLTLLFTEANQVVNIPLSEDQVEALVERNADYPVKVEIVGSATALGGSASTANFRYFLGNAKTGSNWNGTSAIGGPAAFSSITGEKTVTFNADVEKTPEKLGYLILQQQTAAQTEVVIKGIKITYMPALDPLTVETPANEAFPEGISGGNGPSFTAVDGQKWFVMAAKTSGATTGNQPAFDYNTDGSGAADGENEQKYGSEVRAKFSDFEENYFVYDKVRITFVARLLTAAELTAKGWQQSPAGTDANNDKLKFKFSSRDGEYSAIGPDVYGQWSDKDTSEKNIGEPIVVTRDMSDHDKGEWSGFILAFNDWQWMADGVSPYLIRVTKVEFYFDE